MENNKENKKCECENTNNCKCNDENCKCNEKCECCDENSKECHCDEKCECHSCCNQENENAKALKKQIKELNKKIADLEFEISKKNKKIDSLKDQIDQCNANFVAQVQEKANKANESLKAEIKNFQQKQEKEMAEFKKYCVADKLNEIIDIIGKFDQAVSFESNDQKINNFLIGFKMFTTQFKTALEDLHIYEIPVKVGDEFNHDTMEAIDKCTDNPTQKDNHVEKIIDKGYKIYDRLIKPTKVIVAKKA